MYVCKSYLLYVWHRALITNFFYVWHRELNTISSCWKHTAYGSTNITLKCVMANFGFHMTS